MIRRSGGFFVKIDPTMAIPKKARQTARSKATPKVQPAEEPAVVAEPAEEPLDTNPIPKIHRDPEPSDGLAQGQELEDTAIPGRRLKIVAIRAGMVHYVGSGTVDVPASNLPRAVLARYVASGRWVVRDG